MIFTQQCFVLTITNPIILGSDFLETHSAVLDIGDHIITLHCADYMLTTSLTHDLVHNYCLVKIVLPAAIEISCKQISKKIQKNTLIYNTVLQHHSKLPLLPSV